MFAYFLLLAIFESNLDGKYTLRLSQLCYISLRAYSTLYGDVDFVNLKMVRCKKSCNIFFYILRRYYILRCYYILRGDSSS